jgi:hypothetical protein
LDNELTPRCDSKEYSEIDRLDDDYDEDDEAAEK